MQKWKSPEYVSLYMKNYHSRPGVMSREKTQQKGFRAKYRRDALLIVGNGILKCYYCGCDDPRMLEINHVDGGGYKEYYLKGVDIIHKIRRGLRQTDDLNLACRVCNARHFLELRFGSLPYTIIWN